MDGDWASFFYISVNWNCIFAYSIPNQSSHREFYEAVAYNLHQNGIFSKGYLMIQVTNLFSKSILYIV